MRENSNPKAVNLFPRTLAGFYWELIRRFWPFVFGLIALYVAYDVLSKVLPGLSVKWLSDAITVAAPGSPLIPQVLPVAVILGSLFVALFLTDWFAEWIDGQYAPMVKAKTGEILYDRLSRQSVAFFKDNSAGYLVEQGNTIVSNFHKITIDHIEKVLGLVIAIGINMTLMFSVHWTVAALFAACAGIRLTHCGFRIRGMTGKWVTAAQLSAQVTAKYVDSVSNFMNIKLFARRDDERIYLNKVRLEHALARRAANRAERMFWLFPYAYEQLCMVALIFLLLHLYGNGVMNLGDMAFSITAFVTMMGMIRSITWTLPDILDNVSSAYQAYQAIAKPINVCDAPDATPLHSGKCGIAFENLTFGYGANDHVFNNLNLEIQPGEKVGIVGLSGSGKSTMLYLLMRLYDAKGGAVKIGGRDVRGCTLDSLRAAVSFVPQDCTLFNRTLSENISYGAKAATNAAIVGAAKKAQAHDFIEKMDDKYDTVVGDRGVKLSGGQRQRIGIAHAICKDAPIIVMDEATSALDSKTEAAIQHSMNYILKDKTALVVAHRLSTLRRMDRIIVLDHGKIVESGTHAELLRNKDGIYRKLWMIQSDGFIA
ncbi:MAG: ABC transporter ATP-binding protein/permease [Proteobacteria bacterium]|nr:ABC transporter ATP-binding protein/permease [Pseudomonadota bacterium]